MGFDSCTIDIDAGDYPEFFDKRKVVARKNHKCCECGDDSINPGDKYEYVAGKWNGDFMTFKTCHICEEIRTALFCTHVYGYMWESIGEHGECYGDAVALLSDLAKEKLFKFLDKRVS